MRCIDFEYNGQRLSDYGCMICCIDTSPGVETVSIGSQLTLNTVRPAGLHKFRLLSTQYDSAYTVTFQVAKAGCPNQDDTEIRESELSDMMRWLQRKEYHKFKAIYSNGEYANTYYMGTFHIQAIRACDQVIGLELTLQTNAPFGYYEPTEYYMELPDSESSYTVFDHSDEIGYLYPEVVEIECLSQGDLTIYNSMDARPTVIHNCAAGEIITLDGENKQICSSLSHDRLYNDFNYHFIRIMNDDNNGAAGNANVFTAALPCNIRLVYSPIRKVGVI